MKAILKLIILFTPLLLLSCDMEYFNPYDRECPPEIWTPENLSAAIEDNGIVLSWEQTETHFDGFVLERSTDSITWISTNSELINKTIRTYMDPLVYPAKEVYYRIFAKADKNISGLSYSKAVILQDGTRKINDVDGNSYNTVRIGTQVWMQENLNTTKYNDGTLIPNIADWTAWSTNTTGAYCDFNNVAINADTYGRLYNFPVVTFDNTKNVCPTGWHVASDAEWTILIDYLGGEMVAGGKLKEAGTTHWLSPNSGATNESGFTGLPGAYRGGNGAFGVLRDSEFWWCPMKGSDVQWNRHLKYDDYNIDRNDGRNGFDGGGFAVRCIWDLQFVAN